jgi:hypothetical protein
MVIGCCKDAVRMPEIHDDVEALTSYIDFNTNQITEH